MAKRLRIARYITRWGAFNYAYDLINHFPLTIVNVNVVPLPDFCYGVQLHLANGKTALAARRTPKHRWQADVPFVPHS